jgi:hypothetical protein
MTRGYDGAAVDRTLVVMGRRSLLAFLGYVVLVLAGVVVDDPQDLDEAEGDPQAPQGRLLVGVDLGHGPTGYGRGGSSRRGLEVQVDPSALDLELVDLALAVLLTRPRRTGPRGRGAGAAAGPAFLVPSSTERSGTYALREMTGRPGRQLLAGAAALRGSQVLLEAICAHRWSTSAAGTYRSHFPVHGP